MAIKIEHESKESVVGTLGPLVLSYMKDITLNDLANMESVMLSSLKTFPKLCTMSFVSSVPLNTRDELLKRGADMALRFVSTTEAATIVVISQGLKSALVRAALSVYFLLAKTSTPTKVFSNVEEALKWLQSSPNAPAGMTGISAKEIEAFVATVKAKV